MNMNKVSLSIATTNNYEEADAYRLSGYEPIECSFGNRGSVVGKLMMDHHGDLSHLEGVAIRAYRDYRGACVGYSKFVVTGQSDADATFAIAALIGLLPDGLDKLAELVNQVDVNPVDIDLTETREGQQLLWWNQQCARPNNRVTDWFQNVFRWVSVPDLTDEQLLKAVTQEIDRRMTVEKDTAMLYQEPFQLVVGVESNQWGFDCWYRDLAPFVVAFNPHTNSITLGAKSLQLVEDYFGHGGFKNVFNHLGEGWGGRETVGGSPRGQQMTRADVTKVCETLMALIK